MAGRGRGIARLGHVLIDRDWSDWIPIHAWLIEHDEGLILVDTGETARVHQRGYHPRWHPFFRRASQFQLTPHDEIGAQLQEMGVPTRDIRQVVLTHLHTDHAGGLAHRARRAVNLHRRRHELYRGAARARRRRRWSPNEGVARQTNQRILALAREQPLVYLPSHDPQSADRLAQLATLTPRLPRPDG